MEEETREGIEEERVQERGYRREEKGENCDCDCCCYSGAVPVPFLPLLPSFCILRFPIFAVLSRASTSPPPPLLANTAPWACAGARPAFDLPFRRQAHIMFS